MTESLLPRYLEQVTAVVRATRLYPPTGYAWFGKRAPRVPDQVQRVLTPPLARSYLLHQLQAQFYRDFYCPGGARPPRRTTERLSSAGAKRFVTRLQQANVGAGYWDPGWQIRRGADETGLLVEQRGVTLHVPLTACDPKADLTVPDGMVRLRFPNEFPAISPGFYTAAGDTPLVTGDSAALVRLYWNVDAEGAVRLLSLLTRYLNEAGLPFRLKVIADPSGFTRCDAAVLYIRQADYEPVAPDLGRIYAQMRPNLRAATPALTKPLAPGLGLAEDPGQGRGFGQHRCELLAEGLIQAQEAAATLQARIHMVTACFTAAGLSLARPFLNPGAPDIYPFGWGPWLGLNQGERARRPHLLPADESSYLPTAAAFAHRLIGGAISFEDHCNWIGPSWPDQAEQGGVVYRALGPDLYSGTSGIGLFLAEFGAVTQDAAARSTALRALRRALACAPAIPPHARLGLYTGWVGLAWAAVRGGLILQEDALIEQARHLLAGLRHERANEGYDFLSGRAGALVGLLNLGDALADPALHQFAADLGTDLIAAATKHARGYSWPHPTHKTYPHLTGLSHGAAGIGYALLELAAATGDSRFRAAAEQAFAYEQSWFDPVVANWPDFREGGAGRGSGSGSTCATYWCHGAPGIALTRLRAYVLLGTPAYRAAACAALATTRTAIRAALDQDRSDFCLCHGLAGNAEGLRYGSQVLGPEALPDAALVAEVAHFGIAQYAQEAGPWPCGIEGAEAPGLMSGLAGIGLFYLRLHHPQTPSVLLPHRAPLVVP